VAFKQTHRSSDAATTAAVRLTAAPIGTAELTCAVREVIARPERFAAHLPRALRGADDHVAALIHDLCHVIQQPVQLEGHLRDQAHVHDACEMPENDRCNF